MSKTSSPRVDVGVPPPLITPARVKSIGSLLGGCVIPKRAGGQVRGPRKHPSAGHMTAREQAPAIDAPHFTGPASDAFRLVEPREHLETLNTICANDAGCEAISRMDSADIRTRGHFKRSVHFQPSTFLAPRASTERRWSRCPAQRSADGFGSSRASSSGNSPHQTSIRADSWRSEAPSRGGEFLVRKPEPWATWHVERSIPGSSRHQGLSRTRTCGAETPRPKILAGSFLYA